jgi:multiple sugar transport system permease protein
VAETVAPAAGVSQDTGTAARRGRRPRGTRDFRSTPLGWLYSAPAVLIFAGFVIVPTFYTFYVSLWHWNVLNPAMSTYKGLGNYRDLLTDVDPTFTQTLVNSLYFTLGMIVFGTGVSLGLALLLMRGGKAMGAARVMIYLPHATPLIATSIIWVWIFNPQFGFANYLLHLLHLPALQWTQSQSTAMPSVILFSVWHEVGFTTLVFLGGLAVISEETGEAARVDGCGPWREFWYVTWPQLRPVTAFIVVISSITSLQAFTQFYQLTSGGGPNNATTTLSYLVYKEGIVLGDTGYGAALAVVLFLTTVLFTLVRRRTAVGGGDLTA